MIGVGSGSYTTENKGLSISYNEAALSVASMGVDNFLSITPPAGERWDILFLDFDIPAPIGAGSGTHKLTLLVYDPVTSKEVPIFRAMSNFGDKVTVRYGSFYHATHDKRPPTDAGLQNLLSQLFIDCNVPMYYKYNNDTNVAQEGTYDTTLSYQVSKF